MEYKDRKKVYVQAVEQWGAEAQLVIALEELNECGKEICKILRGKGDMAHLAEEVADATIGEIVNAHHNNIGNAALAFIGTSGVQLGWLASQADMLAEDWYIVE